MKEFSKERVERDLNKAERFSKLLLQNIEEAVMGLGRLKSDSYRRRCYSRLVDLRDDQHDKMNG